MKTLYVSDLDGTLLRSDARLSEYTLRTVNRLIGRGVRFAYATARSFETAGRVTEGLAPCPAIVHNGAFILDGATGETLHAVLFSPQEAREVFTAFLREGLTPVVYSVLGGRNRFSYLRRGCGAAQWRFVQSRLSDGRRREIFTKEQALDGEVYYFSCIDEENHLRPVYEKLKERFRCFFARDIYTGDMWLEVLPREASKASAAIRLKELLGCGRIVCFGDEINDIPLFSVADESYAVSNAAEALKAVATGTIGANDSDAVARWLEQYAN